MPAVEPSVVLPGGRNTEVPLRHVNMASDERPQIKSNLRAEIANLGGWSLAMKGIMKVAWVSPFFQRVLL